MVNVIAKSIDEINNDVGYTPSLINARFLKPFDSICLNDICANHENIITIEEGSLVGGFGSYIGSYLHENNLTNKFYKLGVPDNFVGHGTRQELLNSVGLCSRNLIAILKDEEIRYVK